MSVCVIVCVFSVCVFQSVFVCVRVVVSVKNSVLKV